MKRYWLHKKGTNTVCQWNPLMAQESDMESCTHEEAMAYQKAHTNEVRAAILAKTMGHPVENEGKSQAELLKQENIKKGLIPDIREEHAKTMFNGPKALSEMAMSELLEFAAKSKIVMPDTNDPDEIRKAIVEAHSVSMPHAAPIAPEVVVNDDLKDMGRDELNKICDELGIAKNTSNDDKRQAIRDKRIKV